MIFLCERSQAFSQEIRNENEVRSIVNLIEVHANVFKIKLDSVVQKRNKPPVFFKVEILLKLLTKVKKYI
jgi:hypothetical protein